jgi:hypothetical protein
MQLLVLLFTEDVLDLAMVVQLQLSEDQALKRKEGALLLLPATRLAVQVDLLQLWQVASSTSLIDVEGGSLALVIGYSTERTSGAIDIQAGVGRANATSGTVTISSGKSPIELVVCFVK